MTDIVISSEWRILMRLPKGVVCLTTARDTVKRIELRIMATEEDWDRWQRLDHERLIDQEWFEQKILNSDLSVTEVLDLIESERAKKLARTNKVPLL